MVGRGGLTRPVVVVPVNEAVVDASVVEATVVEAIVVDPVVGRGVGAAVGMKLPVCDQVRLFFVVFLNKLRCKLAGTLKRILQTLRSRTFWH